MSGQPLHWLAVTTNLCILPREMAETALRRGYGNSEFGRRRV
jgi:hypothetical protein